MATALPSASDFTGASVTEGQFKTAITNLRSHIAEQSGTEGTRPTARNRIINGNFAINQRGVSGTVTLAAGAYGHDRWKAGAGGCTYTFATVENVTTLTITAGSLQHVIEGSNLETGTYTLSWSGTAQGKIGAGAYAASGVTGSVTGGTNTTTEFGTGTLGKVQFESGSTATPFVFRDRASELAACQRYYHTGLAAARFYATGAGHLCSTPVCFPVQMQATPTITNSGAGRYNLLSAPVIYPGSPSGGRLEITSAAAGDTYAVDENYAANAEL